jgi:site-specific recombinase XerD
LKKAASSEAPELTKSSLQQFVVTTRQRGVKPISCNTYIKALNAFCLWLHDEGHVAERLELPLQKVEKRIVQTLTDAHMNARLATKPKRVDQWLDPAAVRCGFRQFDRDGIRKGPQGTPHSVLHRASQGVESV